MQDASTAPPSTLFCEHEVTIIDTPGQEIFYRMRNYGAAVADIGVLVVACDDGVCTQTQECIGILEQLKVPIIVALNKIDHPDATESRYQVVYGIHAHGCWPVWGVTYYCCIVTFRVTGLSL